MGLETDLTAILREIVQFLECLREAKLPITLENLRENLLARSKNTLTTVDAMGRSTSPEPYLNMNAGSKGLLLAKGESDLQEYVGADEQSPSHHDYYETFKTDGTKTPLTNPSEDELQKDKEEEERENAIINIYSRFSTAQTKSKCHKCGPLSRKEGKKLFVFEQYRIVTYWVGLVGSHLLIYESERDNRPYIIQPIRGYMARPAPNIDPRRSESGFEIFCPGHKTLQFIARTPKDMEQWVAKICQVGCNDNQSKLKDLLENSEIKSQDESSRNKDDLGSIDLQSNRSKDNSVILRRSPIPERKDESKDGEGINNQISKNNLSNSPPPLPARIPRRLPSLPTEDVIPSYEPMEEEDDDIYHKIEDFRDSTRYQNMTVSKKSTQKEPEEEPVMYDDVQTPKKKEMGKVTKMTKDMENAERSQKVNLEVEETYDDVSAARESCSRKEEENKRVINDNHEELVSYDDVESLLSSTKINVDRQKSKVDEPEKSPQKRSFLNRVRSKKESSRKADKKAKRKTPTPPPIVVETLPTYDDVSDLTSKEREPSIKDEEQMETYNCPPPPRPIYAKPPTINDTDMPEELYDDVAECRLKCKEEEKNVEPDVISTKPSHMKMDANKFSVKSEEIHRIDNSENSLDVTEHYQSPRNEPIHPPAQEEEDLYDDIAILADFTARQRDSGSKKTSDSPKASNSPDKKPWSRFRKSRSAESDANRRSCNDLDDIEFEDQQSFVRMNTFQKLINKMENSLGKSSSKSPSTISASKTSPSPNIS